MGHDDDTLPGGPSGSWLHDVDGDLEPLRPEERYAAAAALGIGGMGEVRLALDQHIGREVAVKTILPAHAGRPDLRARFVREARVQGQLEHPAIVPVYDLDRDPDGRAFFTMKRVHGETLEEILEALRLGNEHVIATYTPHKLLSAFARVCLAVDYAHSRGVIHRDLKPANVMLGNFGEVYVLDWGCAKIEEAPMSIEERRTPSNSGSLHAKLTDVGEVIGTPAYMAPEQVEGNDVDALADVYALGGILFELLTLEQLARGDNTAQVLTGVLRGPDTAARLREAKAEVPPELEAACIRATARRRADRYPSARDLADAVERYLSGDRDVELRRAMAREQIERAEKAAAEARAHDGLEARQAALREVGRAAALAPNDPRTMRLLVELLTRPPETLPGEVAAAVERSAAQSQRDALPRAAVATASVGFAFIPALIAIDEHAAALAAVVGGAWILCSIVAWTAFRFDKSYWRRPPYLAICMALAAAVSTLLFGPLILGPALVVGTTAAYSASIAPRHRPTLIVAMTSALVVPVVLAALGLHPVHTAAAARSITLRTLLDASRLATLLVVTVLHLALLAFTVRFVTRYRDALTEAETKNQLFAWQLRQLVPSLGESATT